MVSAGPLPPPPRRPVSAPASSRPSPGSWGPGSSCRTPIRAARSPWSTRRARSSSKSPTQKAEAFATPQPSRVFRLFGQAVAAGIVRADSGVTGLVAPIPLARDHHQAAAAVVIVAVGVTAAVLATIIGRLPIRRGLVAAVVVAAVVAP